jgi:hypothetical protein
MNGSVRQNVILHLIQDALPFDIVGIAAGLTKGCQLIPSPGGVFRRGGYFSGLVVI